MINEQEDFPYIPDELLVWFESAYPDKIVTAEQSPYEQGKIHGVIELIRKLKQINNEREEL